MTPQAQETLVRKGVAADVALDEAMDETTRNIDAVIEFYARAGQNISTSQRNLERISGWMGQPIFLGLTLAFVVVWVVLNIAMDMAGMAPFDAPPYHWLQGHRPDEESALLQFSAGDCGQSPCRPYRRWLMEDLQVPRAW